MTEEQHNKAYSLVDMTNTCIHVLEQDTVSDEIKSAAEDALRSLIKSMAILGYNMVSGLVDGIFTLGLDPANLAGTKKSGECICIFTEGLSAKTYGARGIEKGFIGNTKLPQVKGRDYFGLFPLRGKLLNVRNASTQSIGKNNEIKNAINALKLHDVPEIKELYGLD